MIVWVQSITFSGTIFHCPQRISSTETTPTFDMYNFNRNGHSIIQNLGTWKYCSQGLKKISVPYPWDGFRCWGMIRDSGTFWHPITAAGRQPGGRAWTFGRFIDKGGGRTVGMDTDTPEKPLKRRSSYNACTCARCRCMCIHLLSLRICSPMSTPWLSVRITTMQFSVLFSWTEVRDKGSDLIFRI